MEQAKQKIKNVLSADKDTSKGQSRERIMPVTQNIAKKILEVSGIEVSGYQHSIDRTAVNHALNNHGGTSAEVNRGQLPINEEDMLLLPEVLTHPDNLYYAGKNKLGLDVIRYEKEINGNIIAFEEIRNGRKELALATVYKKKSEKVSETPARTSETLFSLDDGRQPSSGTKGNTKKINNHIID
jgi:hypothetical protein